MTLKELILDCDTEEIVHAVGSFRIGQYIPQDDPGNVRLILKLLKRVRRTSTVPGYYMLAFPVWERDSEEDCSLTTYLEMVDENELVEFREIDAFNNLALGFEKRPMPPVRNIDEIPFGEMLLLNLESNMLPTTHIDFEGEALQIALGAQVVTLAKALTTVAAFFSSWIDYEEYKKMPFPVVWNSHSYSEFLQEPPSVRFHRMGIFCELYAKVSEYIAMKKAHIELLD